jgi:hypothetical protein
MAARKRKPRPKKTENEQDGGTEQDGEKAYPIRPGSQAPEKPLDEQLIDEWEAEHPETLEENGEDFDLLGDGDRLAENVDAAIHSDEYRRISNEEFDELDSLMDDDPEPIPFSVRETDPPQLRLLDMDDMDEFEQIFDDEPGLVPAGGTDESPVTIIEDEELMDSDNPTPAHGANDYPVGIGEPPPSFEDRGMGAGFFVSEEELQPTGDPLPEETDYVPLETPPEVEEGEFSPDIYFPPGPTVEIHKSPMIFADLPPDSGLVEKQVTDDRVARLMNRAENAQRRINDEIDSIELARELLELIRNASTLIMSGKDKYEEAERSLNEVEYRLSYSRRVKVWSDAIAYRLLAYEVFWLMTLGLGALFIPSALSTMIGQLNSWAPNSLPDFILMDDLFLGVSTALWGGLGGVVGAMFALWRHVSLKQDFNPQHKMWYYTQPIMGIPIGVVVFLLVRIGIGFTVEGVLNFSSPYAIYMVAWIAGFQQNVLYEIIRQMLKIFRFQS